MVFSSLEFILLFLPSCILGYYLLLQYKEAKYALLFILLFSLFYYAYWKIENILILFLSIGLNFIFGHLIYFSKKQNKKKIFIFSIIINLSILFYFKYTIFSIETYNFITTSSLSIPQIVLPIGISFFTFQQISYLSDIYTGKFNPTGEGLLSYSLFVCFFPQLVAGPIVHHKEMMPQFDILSEKDCAGGVAVSSVNWENLYRGIVLFSIGLAKKTLIADTLSPVVRYAFDSVGSLTFSEAIFSSLCYSLQLYFDFSGYCDMAVGCALMLNIHLPWNFDSPYQSKNIQEFWRRWHMTLSRWLRDYLYIPLGGNRKGNRRTLINLFLTFVLAGLWHGAAWTFVLWGAMHGCALIVHRIWARRGILLARPIAWFLTFSFVNITWIIFRANDMARLKKFFDAFCGFNGWALTDRFANQMCKYTFLPHYTTMIIFVAMALLICLFSRNSRQISENIVSTPKLCMAIAFFSLSLFAIFTTDNMQEFIYFQF